MPRVVVALLTASALLPIPPALVDAVPLFLPPVVAAALPLLEAPTRVADDTAPATSTGDCAIERMGGLTLSGGEGPASSFSWPGVFSIRVTADWPASTAPPFLFFMPRLPFGLPLPVRVGGGNFGAASADGVCTRPPLARPLTLGFPFPVLPRERPFLRPLMVPDAVGSCSSLVPCGGGQSLL